MSQDARPQGWKSPGRISQDLKLQGLRSEDRKSQRGLVLGALTLCLGGGALVPRCANAADLDAPYVGSQQFPEDKVEFGSGWYIRGDIGATRLPSVQTNIGALFQAPQIAVANSSKLGYDASLGGGYQLNKWFRTDVIADFHQPVQSSVGGASIFCPTGIFYTTNADGSTTRNETNGDCSSTSKGSIRSYDILVNGYVDLGTWYGATPYVGAGVGIAFGHYQTSVTYIQQANGEPYNVTFTDPVSGTTYHNDYDSHASGNFYNFAWALMAGVGIDVYDHTKLDIGYRYLNQGHVPTMNGNLYSHEVRAGLRYMIDN